MKRQTPQHLAAETRIAQRFMRATGLVGAKLPAMHPMDYVFTRPGLRDLYAEIKKRGRQYDTFMMDLEKTMYIKDNNLAGVVIIEWPNDFGFFDLTNDPFTVAVGGRFDRGDPRDVGNMAHYDIKLLKRLA